MSTDSSSSTSADDRNPKPISPKSVEDQLASVALAEPPGELASQETRNGVGFSSASEAENDDDGEEGLLNEPEDEVRSDSGAPGGLAEEVKVGEGLGSSSGRGGVVWGRTNSEVEVDAPASPSSSGYAGERGSSGASSGDLEIDEVVDDDDEEIQEVRSDDAVDGVLDSQASWVPGKRHIDEVFRVWNLSSIVLFLDFISDPRT